MLLFIVPTVSIFRVILLICYCVCCVFGLCFRVCNLLRCWIKLGQKTKQNKNRRAATWRTQTFASHTKLPNQLSPFLTTGQSRSTLGLISIQHGDNSWKAWSNGKLRVKLLYYLHLTKKLSVLNDSRDILRAHRLSIGYLIGMPRTIGAVRS